MADLTELNIYMQVDWKIPNVIDVYVRFIRISSVSAFYLKGVSLYISRKTLGH
jgi:hypothetical protein